MLSQLERFLRDETGATAIEYSLIAALVSIAAIAALTALGGQLADTFGVIIGVMNNVGAAPLP
jgi:pilus assembly protein Flp/PilA